MVGKAVSMCQWVRSRRKLAGILFPSGCETQSFGTTAMLLMQTVWQID